MRLAKETMLTQAEAEKLHAAFNKLDTDGGGFIDQKELEQMYLTSTQEEGFDDANAAVSLILKKFDKNGDGQIDFSEFYEAVTGHPMTESVKKIMPPPKKEGASSCCVIF